MNFPHLFCIVFSFLSLISFSNGLRILFVLPCYGGHFGTMIPLITSLSETNDVTVVQTSPTCQNKLAPFRNRYSFRVIEEDLFIDNMKFTNFLQGLWVILSDAYANTDRLSEYFKVFLSKHRHDFDIMIADSSQPACFLSAEAANFPAAVVIGGFPGGVENVVDKLEVPLVEVMVVKLIFYRYMAHFAELRAAIKLPPLTDGGFFSAYEYISRFPSLVATSPKFYPEHHQSIPHVFIGGPRNANDYGPLDEKLAHWLSQKQNNVVYLSLGTHFTLTEDQITDFVEKIRSQNEYDVIWSLGKYMRVLVDKLDLKTDSRLFFSDYLPQYTLLGQEKVKVFVTHGGFGSTIDLIKRRKPSVCAPQVFDQYFNCRKLASLGIAENIPSFSFEIIDSAIKKLFENYKNYVENADLVAKDFEFYESRERIENFLSKVAAKGEIEVIRKFEFQFCSERCSQAWVFTKAMLFSLAALLLVLVYVVFRCVIRKCSSKTIKHKEN